MTYHAAALEPSWFYQTDVVSAASEKLEKKLLCSHYGLIFSGQWVNRRSQSSLWQGVYFQ